MRLKDIHAEGLLSETFRHEKHAENIDGRAAIRTIGDTRQCSENNGNGGTTIKLEQKH